MKEREISLPALIAEMMLHWRRIAVAMAAGAVLGGIFSYAASVRTVENLKEVQDPESEEEAEELTEEQIQNVERVLAFERIYESKMEYQKTSVLLQLDAGHVYETELTFFVSSENRKRSCDIANAFEGLVTSTQMYDFAASQTSQRASDLKECVTLSRGLNGQSEGAAVFQVRIIHNSRKNCEKTAAAVLRYLREQQKELEKSMGSHRLILLQQASAEIADPDILEQKKNCLNDLTSLADTIAQRKSAFTEEEDQYYERHAHADSRSDSTKTSAKEEENGVQQPAGLQAGYVMSGMLLAACACVFWLFLSYVLSERIRYTDDLTQLYGITQFGRIAGTDWKHKKMGFADRWILSLRDYGRCRYTEEETRMMIVAAVKIAAVQAGLDAVSLIGHSLNENARSICEAIRKELEACGIRTEIRSHVLCDAQIINHKEEVRGAVLVACAGMVFYSGILKELELLKCQEIPVLGGIVVE